MQLQQQGPEFSNLGYSQPQQGYSQPQQGYGYSPQPVQQQPGASHHHATNTTVVINQQVVAKPARSWIQGMCGCFDDCGICVCATFCGLCAACQLAGDMGEFVCLSMCVPNWMTAARTKVRMQLGIQGSICDDCCMTTFCGPCTMCQLMREVKEAKARGEL